MPTETIPGAAEPMVRAATVREYMAAISGSSGSSNKEEVYLRPPGAAASSSQKKTDLMAAIPGPGVSGGPGSGSGSRKK